MIRKHNKYIFFNMKINEKNAGNIFINIDYTFYRVTDFYDILEQLFRQLLRLTKLNKF